MIEFDPIVLQQDTRVHCKTEEEAIVLLDWARSKGKYWSSGKSLKNTNWDIHSYNTYYHLYDGTYGDIRKTSYKVTPFEDLLINSDIQPPKLVGRVLFIPTANSATVLLTITENTEIMFSDKFIFIDRHKIPYSDLLLNSIVSILNSQSQSPLEKALTETSLN